MIRWPARPFADPQLPWASLRSARALLRSNVDFLYGTYVTGLLKDNGGDVRGAVITSRSGRQAITARSVVDAGVDYARILETYADHEPIRIEYVVVGGGTTGAPAGIATARAGARTLVVEYLHDLGRIGTARALYRLGDVGGLGKKFSKPTPRTGGVFLHDMPPNR